MNQKLLAKLLFIVILLVTLSTLLKADEPIIVKFEILKTGHIVVPVKINGQGPFRFIYDTGSPSSTFTTRVSDCLKERAATLEVGDVKVENFPIRVSTPPWIFEYLDKIGGPLSGILGVDFFSRYRTIINYQKGEIVFMPSGFALKKTEQRRMLRLIKLLELPDNRENRLELSKLKVEIQVKNTDDGSPGATVIFVEPESSAESAGVREADKIIRFNDQLVKTAQDFVDCTANVPFGETIRLKLVRNGKEWTLEMELTMKVRDDPRHTVEKVSPHAVVLGLTVEEVDADIRRARVVSVIPNSAADAAGLRPGDIITGLDERWVENVQDLYDHVASLKPAQTIRLKIEREDEKLELQLTTRAGL